MELIELTSKDYNQYFPKTHHVFNSVAFNELNASKVDAVRYFVFKDSKVRLGVVLAREKIYSKHLCLHYLVDFLITQLFTNSRLWKKRLFYCWR
jgi:hypothetical protein